jgi:hypothetical protein
MSIKNNFYVYLHCKPDGTVFYVGKGCLRRAKSKGHRNSDWHKIAKDGYTISIIVDNLPEEIAYEIEKNVIAYFFPMGNLVNVQAGGGPTGFHHLMKGRRLSQKHRENLTKANRSYDRSRYDQSSETLSTGTWSTPNGEFHSLRLAAEANDCAVMTVRNRCLGFVAKRGDKKYPVLPKEGWSFNKKSDKV